VPPADGVVDRLAERAFAADLHDQVGAAARGEAGALRVDQSGCVR
jgi:hypothetical protein